MGQVPDLNSGTIGARPRRSRRLLLAVAGVALVLGLCLAWAHSRSSDPWAGRGLLIDNQTDEELLVYVRTKSAGGVLLSHETVLVAHISPHSRQSAGVVCAAGEMVIRLSDRTEIARREPDACVDDVPWVIPGLTVPAT